MKYSEMKNILIEITDPVEKLEMVMDLGKQLKPAPEGAICQEISGCISLVKICQVGDNFYGFADSSLVRGVVAIILSMVDGKTVSEIKNMNLRKEFESLNISLGAGRMNGVNSILGFLENL